MLFRHQLGLRDTHDIHFSILLELSTTEEPVWTYADAQHKAIMAQMRETYNNAVNVIKGTLVSHSGIMPYDHYFLLLADYKHIAVHDKSSPDIGSPDVLTGIISSQLKTCITAIETKQQDTVIGTFMLLRPH